MIGMAARAVTVYADTSQLPAHEVAEEAEGVDLTVPTQANAADLTITIKQGDSRSGGALLWTLETPWPGIALPGRALKSNIGKRPEEFAKRLVPGVNLREGRADLGSHLRGLGRQIAAKIPGEVLHTLRAVARRVSAEHARRPMVLLVSEEAYVPWELACIEPPLDEGAPSFLATQAIVGRWILGQSAPALPPPVDVQARDITVVWGRYEGVPGWRRLDHAEQEGQDLHRRYHASHVDAKLDPVLGCLESNPGASVLHFSVHGSYDPGGSEDGLVLTDRSVLAPSVVEGQDLASEPFVFLNACQAGSGQEILGNYAGLAAAFVKRGASAVVAPIWSIKDDQAREIALAFYDRAFQGEAPAEILREVRARFGAEPHPNSGTCLAYQFFGHPALRLRREAPPIV
jgi:hypothetical protein